MLARLANSCAVSGILITRLAVGSIPVVARFNCNDDVCVSVCVCMRVFVLFTPLYYCSGLKRVRGFVDGTDILHIADVTAFVRAQDPANLETLQVAREAVYECGNV